MKASERAKELVRKILVFSQPVTNESQEAEIATVVKEALQLLRATLPTTIEINEEIQPGCGNVPTNRTAIHQVVMNLCTNAFQALRPESLGTVLVSLSPFDVGSKAVGEIEGLTEGPYVKLTVSDTGPGIDPAIRDRIFDPFFTTKDVGEGTGLGLSVVHGIVNSRGGSITLRTGPESGTSFSVYLPRVEGLPERTETVESVPSGDEHILFVDDEEMLVQAGKLMLEHLGYTVTARSDSREALELFSEESEEFDLVISDVTMPKMNGVVLAEHLLEIRPDIPIVLTTGFTDLFGPEDAENLGIREVMVKPYPIHTLAKTIRSALAPRSVIL